MSRPVFLFVISAVLLLAIMRCDGEEPVGFSPTVQLLRCPPDTVLYGVPCVFGWIGSDNDGLVEGYCHGLNDDTPETWTTAEVCTLLNAPIGRNVFFVRAQDDDGRWSETASCAFVVDQVKCQVTPAILDFGDVDVGSSLDKAFSISNISQETVSGEISEACSDYEVISGGGEYVLNGGETQDVTVRFSPGSCGTKTCAIGIGVEDCPDVSCVGEGGGSRCEVSPAGLDFGVMNITQSSEMSFTISNTGCATLAGEITESCEEFSIVSGASYSLSPGQSEEVTVLFTSMSCGLSQCAVSLGNEACPSVSCTGTGEGSVCDVRPGTLDFGGVAKGAESVMSFWIRNIGCTEQEGHVTEVCPAYYLDSEPSWVLAPGESTEVSVRFSPTSCDDEATCSVDTGNLLAGTVLCTGEVGCGCWISDEDRFHNFGKVDFDIHANYTVNIKNLSCETLTLDIRFKSGCPNVFSFKSGEGEVTLAPDDEHSVAVKFSPTESKSYECFLDLGECGEIKLVGSGKNPDTPIPTYQKKCSGM